jgi:hypothetical protein
VRVQHRRRAPLQRGADSGQRPEAHPGNRQQLDLDAFPLRQLAHGAVLSQREDARVDAAPAAARREVDDELLEPAQAEAIDEVRDANCHADPPHREG